MAEEKPEDKLKNAFKWAAAAAVGTGAIAALGPLAIITAPLAVPAAIAGGAAAAIYRFRRK